MIKMAEDFGPIFNKDNPGNPVKLFLGTVLPLMIKYNVYQ